MNTGVLLLRLLLIHGVVVSVNCAHVWANGCDALLLMLMLLLLLLLDN